MTKKRTFIVADNPAKSLKNGDQFTSRFCLFPPLGAKGSGSIEQWDHFGSALIALIFWHNGETKIEGSGVLIGLGLALAARHVFDSDWDALASGEVECWATSITPKGAVLWHVHQIRHGQSDVVILSLDLRSEWPPGGLLCAVLTTRTPAVGEPIMIAGTRDEGSGGTWSSLNMSVRVGVGEVGEVHATGRDRLLLPDPSFEVSCLTVGGMSGGPAFDKDGKLLGVLSRSWSTEDNEGPSYVSLWWPVAGNMIDEHWLPGLVNEPTNLVGLLEKGLIRIERPEALQIALPQPDRTHITYYPWT